MSGTVMAIVPKGAPSWLRTAADKGREAAADGGHDNGVAAAAAGVAAAVTLAVQAWAVAERARGNDVHAAGTSQRARALAHALHQEAARAREAVYGDVRIALGVLDDAVTAAIARMRGPTKERTPRKRGPGPCLPVGSAWPGMGQWSHDTSRRHSTETRSGTWRSAK